MKRIALGLALLMIAVACTRASEPTTTTTAPAVENPDALDPSLVSGIAIALSPTPPGASVAVVGSPTRLVADVVTVQPLFGVELWAGDRLVDVFEVDADTNTTAYQIDLHWIPEEEGTTSLTGRAVDVDGRTAPSNLVRMVVAAAELPVRTIPITVQEGDTPASIGSAHGLTPPQVRAIFPFDPPETPLEPGSEVHLPGDEVEDPSPPQTEQSPLQPLAPTARSNTGLRLDTTADPCAPMLTADLPEGATDVELAVAPGTGDFGPLHVANLSELMAGDGQPLELGPGLSTIMLTFYEDGLPRSTPPATYEAPDDCGGEFEGPYTLVNGLLAGVDPEIQEVFFYSSDGGAWTRHPAEGQTTVARTGDVFDFNGSLPEVTAATDFEVWGWTGPALVSLGTFRFLPDDSVPPWFVLGIVETDLKVEAPAGLDGYAPGELVTELVYPTGGKVNFHWSTNAQGTTHLIWQAFWTPAPPNHAPISSGSSVFSGVVKTGPGSGVFEVDVLEMVDPEAAAARNFATLGLIYTGAPDHAFSVKDLLGQLAPQTLGDGKTPISASSAQQGNVSIAPPTTQGTGDPTAVAQVGEPVFVAPPTLYFRIFPMKGDQWSGVSSNLVTIHTDIDYLKNEDPNFVIDPDQPPYTITASVLPPKAGDPWLQYCIDFVGWDETQRDPAYDLDYKYWDSFEQQHPGALCTNICYTWHDNVGYMAAKHGFTEPWLQSATWKTMFGGGKCGSSSGGILGAFESLGKLVVDLWDSIVEGFRWLKDKIAEGIAIISGCNAAGGAVADESDAEGFCKAVAKIAINIVLMYFGVPPDLPTSQEAKELGKGKIKEVLIDQANQLGVPCDEMAAAADLHGEEDLTCDKWADALLDQAEKELQAQFAQDLKGSGFNFPPGALAIPFPAGQTVAPMVRLEITPTPGAPLGGMKCGGSFSGGSTYAAFFNNPLKIALLGVKPPQPPGAGFNQPPANTVFPGHVIHNQGWHTSYMVPFGLYQTQFGIYSPEGGAAIPVFFLDTEDLGYSENPQTVVQHVPIGVLPKDRLSVQDWFVSNWYPAQIPYESVSFADGAQVNLKVNTLCAGNFETSFGLPQTAPVPMVKAGG